MKKNLPANSKRANQPTVRLAPSLICLDLCNLEREVARLEALGLDWLHVDILDGQFSPSLPIGLDVVRQLRKKTRLLFDTHLMVRDNEFFIRELTTFGIQRLCFHPETTLHVDRMIGLIRDQGIEAGIALTPAAPLSFLDYIADRLDFVLLMLINPGFAGHPGQTQVPYAARKVAECHAYLQKHGRNIPIEVDGRISFDTIPNLVAAGADILVAGTSCLFDKNGSWPENLARTTQAINSGLKKRKGQIR